MKPIEKFLKNFDEQFKKAKFKNIKPDKSNLNKIYKNNISIWYYFNSDKIEKKDGTKEINSKLDTINHVILKNPENFIFCKTKDGFRLTESDFINSELSIIDTIENFNISEKKQFNIYRKHLIDKLEELLESSKNKSFISKRVQYLFNFIDYLHSNIDNFKSYEDIIQNFYSLDEQRKNLKPEKNFKEKLKYDEVQNELEQKFKIIDNNIIQKIKEKTIKFDICDWNQTNTIWNYNISDIRKLKENFTTSDVRIILKQKQKYIEFREKTDCNYFQTFFFSDMDKTLKELFNFFNVSIQNEFENFETKTVKVNSIKDALQILKNDKKGKFEIILDNHSTENEKQPQQTETKKPDESYKDEILFKVGLLFASGKMEKYYYINNKDETIFKEKYTAPKIANDIGFSNYNKYILATINNYPKENSNGNKNIFNSLDKMTKIIQHCKENNIKVVPYFLERLPTE